MSMSELAEDKLDTLSIDKESVVHKGSPLSHGQVLKKYLLMYQFSDRLN